MLTGCSTGPLGVAPPRAPAAHAATCAVLQHGLPDTVAGQRRRDTTPQSRLTAAWGSPAIVLRCGVGRPPALTAVSPQIVELAPPGAGAGGSVEWFLEPVAGGTVATTVHRATYVQVRVPPDYGPDVNALLDLVPAIAAADAASEEPLPLPPTTPAG